MDHVLRMPLSRTQNKRGTRDHLERGHEWLKIDMAGITVLCASWHRVEVKMHLLNNFFNFETVPYLKLSFVLRVALVITVATICIL